MRLCPALLFSLLLLAAPPALAQNTFRVTVETKSATHPRAGQGHPDAFVIDAVEANVLTLERGQTYTFNMAGVPGFHPFILSTDAMGGSSATRWTEGVTGNGATGSQTLTFAVPMSAPDELYYNCNNHSFMGGTLMIVDATDARDPTRTATLELAPAFPNPAGTRARLVLTASDTEAVTAAVYDATGRRVAVLFEGAVAAGQALELAVDTARLPVGTYTVRVAAGADRLQQGLTVVR